MNFWHREIISCVTRNTTISSLGIFFTAGNAPSSLPVVGRWIAFGFSSRPLDFFLAMVFVPSLKN
jgi:hypothetical protein